MIITQTPLRVSFVGGGTDLRGFYSREPGCVLSTAIDKYVFVIVKERFDDKIVLNYSQKEIVDRVDEIQHDLVREAMKKTGVDRGVEITTLADIPSRGTGLGSSSSMTVGLLNALYAYTGEFKDAETLAREACEIEIEILGAPIGKQDQYIVAYGNIRKITFFPDEKVDVDLVKLDYSLRRRFNERLMLFYTGKTRSASSILTEQRKHLAQHWEILHQMSLLPDSFQASLSNGDLDEAGRILNRNWEHKKQLASGVTDGQINDLYERAMTAGALGGKITGAGGGGFLLLYCPGEKQENVRQALSHLTELPFRFENQGSKIIFNIHR
jgi:D-glycero-alpha-D-manno-heptose-7-phosphate kinase